MALQVHWRCLLDGGPSCSSSHLDERGGNLAQQQPEGVCMGGFPGLGMGRLVGAEKNKTQNKGANGEARCLSASFGEATICLTNGVPWVRPSGLGL